MKNRWMIFLLIGALLCGLSGCKKAVLTKAQEESAGTGYGTTEKSVLTMQDLYFLRPGSNRKAIAAQLGSPLFYALQEQDTDTYRLTGGETLVLTYNYNDKVTAAELTDTAGKKQDFFLYLNELGIISNYQKEETKEPETPDQPEETPEQPDSIPGQSADHVQPVEPEQTPEEETPVKTEGGYFSAKRYTYEMAEQILKAGVERETVLSAFGKPNSFSSVNFAKDSYLIDVYAMEDGSSLCLDYGYNRMELRAVQKRSGTTVSNYIGSWGQEEKPEGYIRLTRNQSVFNTLKRNAKPSEIYRRFGAPDWLEGTANHYRDAYMLRGGDIFYLDFGPGHTGLTAIMLQKADGSIVNYTLK